MLACCAFAVFLLNQLLVPFAFLRERLWGKGMPRANPAVAWSAGASTSAFPARRAALRPVVILIVLLETLAIGGSVTAATIAAHDARNSTERQFLHALHASICRAVGRPLS
ncbi:MAG: hypothetical protein JWO83_3184 [Caulobacteraceae bacterium]|nr:hypothetical protein [Caulobacteraceae bacterium]